MLKEKILDKTATLGVVGLGYVGLPLAVEKAKAGFLLLRNPAFAQSTLPVGCHRERTVLHHRCFRHYRRRSLRRHC